MKKKVLFIDDELAINESHASRASQELDSMGYSVIPCRSFDWSNKILPLLQEHYSELRLIICDLLDGSGEQPGWSIVSYIKNGDHSVSPYSNFLKQIPIIIYTKGTEEKIANGRNRHLFDHMKIINKPSYPELRSCSKILIELFDEICKDKLKYKIAISYTWENKNKGDNHQSFVKAVTDALYMHYSKDRVFLDKDKMYLTNGRVSTDVVKYYEKGCEYALVFLSSDYAKTGWTEKEWAAIKTLDKGRVFFLAIDELNSTEVAKTLYSEKIDDIDKDNSIVNGILPLYYPCDEIKSQFDRALVQKNIEQYLRILDNIKQNIVENQIVRTISSREQHISLY